MKSLLTHKNLQNATTKKRLQRIHQYFQDNPGCTINEAVTFIPETQNIVQRYSKNREKYLDV